MRVSRIIIAGLIIIAMSVAAAPALYADEPHENPDIAKRIYSGISLLRYFSNALDSMIKKNAAGAEVYLNKEPFVNIPEEMEDATEGFASSGKLFSGLLVDISLNWEKQSKFLRQFRLVEAARVAEQISIELPDAYRQLDEIEKNVIETGEFLKISTSPRTSELRITYDEVIDKIHRSREMLDRLAQPLLNPKTIEELLKSDSTTLLSDLLKSSNPGLSAELLKSASPDIIAELLASANLGILKKLEIMAELMNAANLDPSASQQSSSQELFAELLKSASPDVLMKLLSSANPSYLAELMKPTSITLEIKPNVAFVGDEVAFEGRLTSRDKPVENRRVEILLNNSSYVTASTGIDGYYHGTLRLPYWYIPSLEAQALYYPQNEDVGHYLAASSEVITVSLKFYTSSVEVRVVEPAYPGRKTTAVGSFDYGQSPTPEQRRAELYLDDVFVAQFAARQTFTQELAIEPDVALGKHTLTVSAPAAGRYSPTTASSILEVIRANPVLELNTPRVAIIPGNIGVNGRLSSEVGTLENAWVEIAIDGSSVQFTTSPDGTFENGINMGTGLNLLGSQMITIRVQPWEPWNSPMTTTRSVFVVNGVNCGVIIAMLLFLGIYLPRRFRTLYLTNPVPSVELPEVKPVTPVVVYKEKETASSPAKASAHSSVSVGTGGHNEPAGVILDLYRRVLKLVQKLSSMVLKPQQTLREYARDNTRTLGPASKYFLQFTYIIERLIYGTYKPASEDVERGVALSQAIKEETKSENL